MSLLAPLGFLGLLGILVLILIYVLKPNYQQKIVSSTFVWKLSLRYKKKSLPINRFRNIIIFVCQILIITVCSLLLTQPIIEAKKEKAFAEKVMIIDASASMRMEEDGVTRFERAVELALLNVDETVNDGGVVTLILANEKPTVLASRCTTETVSLAHEALAALVARDEDGMDCSYGSADMEEAVELAREVLKLNPEAEVLLYTGTTYIDKGNVEVVDVSLDDEWNVAVHDVRAELVENFYSVSVDVGCYGIAKELTICCTIYGVNDDPAVTRTLTVTEEFSRDEPTKTVVFSADDGFSFYAYDYLHVSIEDEADSFADDNYFYLYGGSKHKMRIQYASPKPNPYFTMSILELREHSKMSNYWGIEFSSVMEEKDYQYEGFNFYIFEHTMPKKMPTDGVVLLMNPDTVPAGGGFTLGKPIPVGKESTLSGGTPHPITQFLKPEQITIAEYTPILSNYGFEELLSFNGSPVLLAKNEEVEKVMVFSINLNKSNMGVRSDLARFFYSAFNYYFPMTLPNGNIYEIGETVTVNGRGTNFEILLPDSEEWKQVEELPVEIYIDRPGTYTLAQHCLGEGYVNEMFFVCLSADESNILKEIDALPEVERVVLDENEDKDLLVYFMAALLLLQFVEWWLQAKEYF